MARLFAVANDCRGYFFVAGAGAVLDGFFHLDCRGIDAECTNDSWHAHAHKIESGITAAATLAAPLLLGLAFRRMPAWRDSWLPSVLTPTAMREPSSRRRSQEYATSLPCRARRVAWGSRPWQPPFAGLP